MPIQLLPPQLANQIAAGEVVERPASVVKELVENSLDAGATQIDIDIEKGGSKLIRIRDNGCGIAEQELVLALSRHATSKISSLADLEHIASLGFRGEALASISSVARLTLTSKPAMQAAAWQAAAAGRDMAVQVRPAAHPTGTSIEVLDLFFNTPARRRFLRSDKTEFSHIDELIKRLALSRFDVGWTLTHNAQSVRRLPVADSESARQKRLAALCGRSFAEQALWIENQYGTIRLSGWILAANACQQTAACQYSYVNGRMMRDKLLNHAIRQAYGELLPAELQPAFVLYLELDATEVDVNVHPAKHEVRFHQARLVHDFVVQALADALAQAATTPQLLDSDDHADTREFHPVGQQSAALHHYVAAKAPVEAAEFIAEPIASGNLTLSSGNTRTPHYPRALSKPAQSLVHNQQQMQYLAANQMAVATDLAAKAAPYLLLENCFALCNNEDQLSSPLLLVDLAASVAPCWRQQVQTAPLLLPVRLPLTLAELPVLLSFAETLEALGFDLLIKDNTAIVRAVPIWLRHTAISQWFGRFLEQLPQLGNTDSAVMLLTLLLKANYLQAELLLNYYPEALLAARRQARPLTLNLVNSELSVVSDAP
ncbi:DNA mismatch repair protein MutL [Alishewanella longhuensis]|uniref:DNA mismatch repair protein MutL n=1 Tax=Alishewanella longhuensis TaxID=1091037 RepID=A0ABQ3KWD2_9ALTE|nr:DNA mismatch repair endonuclease MutL [Alishewanella longhuensis]GHG65785.1 DNA mismatch repair protein MutL [Alishewanella longhuensis]